MNLNFFTWFNRTNFIDFSWLKKAKFIELDEIDVSEDPVRPELDLEWRKSSDRKIYGLEHNNKIEAIMCLAFTNDIPHTVRELDLMSKVTKYEENADTIIAYTVWSKKKGAGQKIMEEALQYAKNKGFKRIVTLSPLTPMATHYHIRNGAKLLGHNPTTQNFEYSL
jgi:predicted GNAT family acetyltransferase|tara:strand:- start:597 stop:1094 length:498 start_codon:yes stop_codon:yes gene_type:complete